MKRYIIIIFLFLGSGLIACTTAVISGKFTSDGRPLLLKHRDSNFIQNKLMYFDDGKYNYIGLINSEDKKGNEVWGGVNSQGFAIINSASYNLKDSGDTTSFLDKEGFIMKKALQECKTLKDFENLLTDHIKPLGVEANFGVIDAEGGAAYYETNNYTFLKIDANDPIHAPFGYVIRTNFSFNGKTDEGYGYIRYLTTEELFYNASAEKNLNHKFILQDVSRSLKHSLLKVDYSKETTISKDDNSYISFLDFIPRSSSVSTVLIQGVKDEESPELSTLWTILGFQLTSVAIPTWVKTGNRLPDLLISDSSGNAPLCNYALKLKEECFPIKRGSGYNYIKLSKVINKENEGIIQKLRPVENEILLETEERIQVWRKNNKLSLDEVYDLYSWVNRKVKEVYNRDFNLQ